MTADHEGPRAKRQPWTEQIGIGILTNALWATMGAFGTWIWGTARDWSHLDTFAVYSVALLVTATAYLALADRIRPDGLPNIILITVIYTTIFTSAAAASANIFFSSPPVVKAISAVGLIIVMLRITMLGMKRIRANRERPTER